MKERTLAFWAILFLSLVVGCGGMSEATYLPDSGNSCSFVGQQVSCRSTCSTAYDGRGICISTPAGLMVRECSSQSACNVASPDAALVDFLPGEGCDPVLDPAFRPCSSPDNVCVPMRQRCVRGASAHEGTWTRCYAPWGNTCLGDAGQPATDASMPDVTVTPPADVVTPAVDAAREASVVPDVQTVPPADVSVADAVVVPPADAGSPVMSCANILLPSSYEQCWLFCGTVRYEGHVTRLEACTGSAPCVPFDNAWYRSDCYRFGGGSSVRDASVPNG